ncbi:hypothetical protein ACQ86N_22530 [Puia sp. P3]|uniref:hypothetical protein n=1 Tax=Puia sp. P3 TaxID=3423952 RepID=UPI003D66AE99
MKPVEPIARNEAMLYHPDTLFRYDVPVQWIMTGTVPIIAETVDEALAAAMKSTLPRGYYLSDSFSVTNLVIHTEVVKDRNGHPIHLKAEVHVPDPIYSDLHQHAFDGQVTGTHYQYVTVADQEGNAFDIEPERLEVSVD